MKTPIKTTLFIVFTLFIFACKKKQESNWTLQKSKLKHSYLAINKILIQSFENSVDNYSVEMNLFLTVPASYALDDCKKSWKTFYNDFLLFSAVRNIQGDLNFGFDEKPDNYDLYGFDYSYIDYTANQPNSGIINNSSSYPVINSVNLIDWHKMGGDENVTLGFHSIEFLLWGEDLTFGIPGQRTNMDYLQNSVENERRMEFLDAAWSQLEYDLQYITFDKDYENKVLSMNENEFFNNLIDSYIHFLEDDFISASLETPLNTQSQHDEISDFSDNTMENLESKLQSLKYAFDGSDLFEVDKNTWYFLSNFIEDLKPTIAESISNSLYNIEVLLGEVTMDFDQAIQDASSRTKLMEIVSELKSIKSDLETFKAEVG